MKNFFLASLLFLSCAYGQVMDSTIAKLKAHKLIDESQLELFTKALGRELEQTRASYLNALYEVEFKKLTGQSMMPLGSYVNFGDKKPSEKEQKKINKEITEYLQRLQKCGLVTTKQFNEQGEKIKNNSYVHFLEFLPDLTANVAYEDWIEPAKIISFGEKLLTNQVISKEAFDSLQQDAKADRITSHNQLIGYCKQAIQLDLAKYSDDPAVYLEQIHREVSGLLPELSFTGFKYKIEVDSAISDANYTSYNVTVSIKVNGKPYRQKSFISPEKIGKKDNYFGKIGYQEFYQIFNKILADNQSELRLHNLRSTFADAGMQTHRNIGIIVLKKAQTEMFRYFGSYLDPSYENFKNKLTSKFIKDAIVKYQELGLFKHLTDVQVKAGQTKVAEADIKHINEVLLYFPGVVHMFDTELGNLEDPYAELVREMAKISHGDFKPEEVRDDFDLNKPRATVSFKLAGKSYKTELAVESDWIDTEFFRFVDGIVEENKLPGRFCDLYSGGQEAIIIYLTPEQQKYLRENRILVFGDQWQEEIEE
jgi:hypothetical protein